MGFSPHFWCNFAQGERWAASSSNLKSGESGPLSLGSREPKGSPKDPKEPPGPNFPGYHETGAEAGAPSEDVEEGWIQQLEFFKEEADPPSCASRKQCKPYRQQTNKPAAGFWKHGIWPTGKESGSCEVVVSIQVTRSCGKHPPTTRNASWRSPNNSRRGGVPMIRTEQRHVFCFQTGD